MSETSKSGKSKIKSWYSNRYQIVVVQRNILLLFTLVSMLSVAVAVIFVKNIMSSKSLEPYVIEVEEKTGIPVIVDQLTSKNFTADVMVRKYFINQFVQAASGYDPKTYKMDVEKVRLMSSADVYGDFRRRIYAKELGADASIDIRIKSVQFPNSNTAQIRLATQTRILDKGTMQDQIITMTFYFTDTSLTMEERLINPLGFQVTKYLIAEEVFKF